LLAVALAAFVGTQTSAAAAPPLSAAAAVNHPAEVTIADSRRMTFVSHVNGHRYKIDIALPDVPPPSRGYPVIYVLDGDFYFASMAEAARVFGNAPQAVVVGIGYPHDPAWVAGVFAKHRPLPAIFKTIPPFEAASELERVYDLTLPLNAAQRADEASRGLPLSEADTGAVDDFLKTIEMDVKPRIYALAPVDRGNQILFGHSLGGLAVLEALFSEPAAFRTFIAASPSIWWGDKEVLRKEKRFSDRVSTGAIVPRVLITVGGEEDSVATLAPQIQAQIRKLRMAGNACDLARRVKALQGARGYEVADCAVFPLQDHGISVWPSMGRAISFAFPH
jgi:predicted alpha/beta superfamily hydrolase